MLIGGVLCPWETKGKNPVRGRAQFEGGGGDFVKHESGRGEKRRAVLESAGGEGFLLGSGGLGQFFFYWESMGDGVLRNGEGEVEEEGESSFPKWERKDEKFLVTSAPDANRFTVALDWIGAF